MRVLLHCPTCGHRPPTTLERCPRCGGDLEPHPLSSGPGVAPWFLGLAALALLVLLGVWLLAG